MALTQTLNIKQTQKLVMTQDLRQSIELLPLSTLELAEKIESELIENPLLEEVNNPEKQKTPELFSTAEIRKNEVNEFVKNSDISWHDTYSIEGPRNYDNEASNKNQRLIESSPLKENLSDYLISQLRLLSVSEEDLEIGELLISMLDEKGFITASLEELCSEMKLELPRVQKVLTLIHTLDPVGIGASDIQDCLYIQSKIFYPNLEKLHSLLLEHFKDLERLDYRKISKNMKINEEEVEEMAKLIKKLQPYPATPYEIKKTDYIIPDVVIQETEGEFNIFINDEWLPKLSINSEYKKALHTIKNSIDKEYISSKMNSAQWLIRSINQRRQTLFKVVSCIVDFQIEFFKSGINFIKPLTLKDIAERLDMHESTISRITTNKYVQTSWGILELKWFFSSGVRSQEGGIESSKKIHDIIKTLVKEEDENNPLSDQDLVDLMEKRGIEIARRTVAKYRKILKILPANRRKKIKDLKGI
ncbi:MAG: RNA polymerase factor sigma-54 [Leptospiraceae bacterium]|nr:RNA polymerase factor sigma-54 [Leptospiraceae bacterium]